jgi:hypothetical protein
LISNRKGALRYTRSIQEKHLTRKKKSCKESTQGKSKVAAHWEKVLKEDFKSTTALLHSSKLLSFISHQIHHKRHDIIIFNTAASWEKGKEEDHS